MSRMIVGGTRRRRRKMVEEEELAHRRRTGGRLGRVDRGSEQCWNQRSSLIFSGEDGVLVAEC